jgi:ribulose-bisphosphate carboxylase large chain
MEGVRDKSAGAIRIGRANGGTVIRRTLAESATASRCDTNWSVTPITMRLTVTYHLAGPSRAAAATAADIAFEQTVELAPDAVPSDVAARVAGRVESVKPLGRGRGGGRSVAVISFDPAVVCGDLPQLLNLLFGNISFKAGIFVADIAWPEELLEALPGPALGAAGVRDLTRVRGRPLVCIALKPLGLSAARLATLAYQLALAGIDIIKDDHSLVDQPTAPFRERVERCQEAVTRANRETGGNVQYFPNVTGAPPDLTDRAGFARQVGCRGVVVNALPAGLGSLRALGVMGLAVMSHPSLAGAFFHADHGIAPDVLLGDVFRLAGSDAVIYPNVGGRFTLSRATCVAINARLRRPLGPVAPAFPVPAGGIDAARVPHWIERYGADTIFLLGGSLYRQPDLARAAERLVETVRRHSDG